MRLAISHMRGPASEPFFTFAMPRQLGLSALAKPPKLYWQIQTPSALMQWQNASVTSWLQHVRFISDSASKYCMLQ